MRSIVSSLAPAVIFCLNGMLMRMNAIISLTCLQSMEHNNLNGRRGTDDSIIMALV